MSHSRCFKLSISFVLAASLLQSIRVGARETLTLDFHDGVPAWQIDFLGEPQSVGNFMTGINVGPAGVYYVKRVWFYHGGDYEDSGVPYNLYLVNRNSAPGDDSCHEIYYLQSATTCNYCWEYHDVNWFVVGDSDLYDTIGLFVQPLGGMFTRADPKLWIDASSNHHHVGAILSPRIYPDVPPGQDRSSFDIQEYTSDAGVGEVLVGMEI